MLILIGVQKTLLTSIKINTVDFIFRMYSSIKTKVSPGTISNLNQKAYEHIETWRSRKLTGEYAYVYVDGIYLKRSWGGEVQNVSVLVAIGVSTDGYREIIGAVEGMKEDFESWHNFFIWLKERGLTGVRLIVGDKCLGMLESIADVLGDFLLTKHK